MLRFINPRYTTVAAIIISIIFVFADCAKKVPEVWYCPMHKHYQTDKPGSCPICGMDLVKKEEPKAEKPATGHEGHGTGMAPQTTEMPQTKALMIPQDKQQIMGILTAKPEVRKLAATLRVPAQVAYEPELYSALVEYQQLQGQAASLPDGVSGSIASSAKLRVRQYGLSDAEIHQYIHSQTALSRLIVGNAGGRALITLQIPESDIALLKKGQKISVTVNAYQEQKFNGEIIGIGTLVDNKRRVFLARALVKDLAQTLRSQMFVSADITLATQKGVSLPRSAIFNTGMRSIVFVKTGSEEFVPREVRIIGGNEEFALLSGITAADDIVVSSAFLLDSEARLKIEGYK